MTRPPITDLGITKPVPESTPCDCPPGWKHQPDCVHVTGVPADRKEEK